MAKKLILNPKDPLKMIGSLTDYFTGVKNTFDNSELMKAADKLPANLRSEFDAIKSNVDSILVQMSDRPSDQVPAAEQAHWALECMARSMVELEEMRTKGYSMIEDLQKRYDTASQELSSFTTRLEKKELVTKVDAEAAVAAARKEEKDRFALFGARRAELMKANLPTPAGDELLEGDEAAWKARLIEAGKRAEKLKEFGGSFEKMNAERRVKVLLGDKAGYEDCLTLAQELSGKAGKTTEQEGEPLAGGRREAEAGKEGKKRKFGF